MAYQRKHEQRNELKGNSKELYLSGTRRPSHLIDWVGDSERKAKATVYGCQEEN